MPETIVLLNIEAPDAGQAEDLAFAVLTGVITPGRPLPVFGPHEVRPAPGPGWFLVETSVYSKHLDADLDTIAAAAHGAGVGYCDLSGRHTSLHAIHPLNANGEWQQTCHECGTYTADRKELPPDDYICERCEDEEISDPDA